MSWISALAGLLAGVIAGYFLSRVFGESAQRSRNLQQELDQARDEHAVYRREVSDHFARTAAAVNQLTDSYRNVHRELREGAHALCDNDAAESALAFDQSRLIDAQPAGTEGGATESVDGPPATPTPAESSKTDAGRVESASAQPDTDLEAATADPVTPPQVPGDASEAADESTADVPEVPANGEDDDKPWDPSPGGASWTPATAPDDASEPPEQPRDYAAEDDTGGARAARH